MMMQIQIPPGAQPGQTLNISLSDGRTVGVPVPPGETPQKNQKTLINICNIVLCTNF
jgi:hypothetical protein